MSELTMSVSGVTIKFMDGDFFSKISRPGRDTAEAALSALAGGAWDPFLAENLMDKIVAANGTRMITPRYSYTIDSVGQIIERVGGDVTKSVVRNGRWRPEYPILSGASGKPRNAGHASAHALLSE